MTQEAFDQFVSPNNAWIHDAIKALDEVFGVQDVDATLDESDRLVVTVIADPQLA